MHGSICEDAALLKLINSSEDIKEKVYVRGRYNRLEEIYGQAKLGIAPLKYGSGTKLKVLDYISLGLPVIGTDVALYGFEHLNELHGFHKANKPNEFIQEIDRIIALNSKACDRFELEKLIPKQ